MQQSRIFIGLKTLVWRLSLCVPSKGRLASFETAKGHKKKGAYKNLRPFFYLQPITSNNLQHRRNGLYRFVLIPFFETVDRFLYGKPAEIENSDRKDHITDHT
ncbi:hypothetical protein LX92_04083 [Maribacter polysiphoniae]|uniref:Uncharacterized protein n=1 Tax=Maribacter polysiphoniae TaxID=429344 RepID=A0A316EB43_9FLAO|nr:hypothetical protein LX92_04083 [Maribacter polysiphoniae]